MKRTHYAICFALVLALLAISGGAQQSPGRGGQQPVSTFHTDVPAHPYDLILGRPERDRITLSILNYADAEAYVEYGAQAGEYSARTPLRQLKEGIPAEVVLPPLQPDTGYHYRLRLRSPGAAAFSETPDHAFHTQRPSGSAFTFTIIADSHLDERADPTLYARTLANALADRPDFHLDLGDTFMTDKHVDLTDASKQYLAQRYYLGLLGSSAPVFLVGGNHDGEVSGAFGETNSMAAWSNSWRRALFSSPLPDGFYTGNAEPLQDYYAWEWGDASFVVLDPYWYTPRRRGTDDNWTATLGAAQYQWLKQTLETSHAKLRFVFIHQLVGGDGKNGRGGVEAVPFFEWGGHNADGSEGFAARRPGWDMPIHQLLVRNHVSVVFHGHDHLFAKQDLGGIVYQEVPQPAFPGRANPNLATDWGYKAGVLLGSSGHMRVTVADGKARVEYIRAALSGDEALVGRNGSVLYSYEVHGQP